MPEEMEQRREEILESADLRGLRARLADRAAPLLARMPVIPAEKALLSADGGVCPDDGTALLFDPWSPDRHRCPRCGREWSGERRRRHWARWQHLWLAERAAHLAALHAFGGHEAAAARAIEILRAYGGSYLSCPNQDNVLGPSRLFFSTYLESIWITDYIAAAVLLRSAGALDDATTELVSVVADEAANIIGEFDEGFSNRQTWNNAALIAISVWFEDEDLAARAIESETGLATHLLHGFGQDGMWYEGENYHLFTLQGILTGLAWARAAGVNLAADPQLAGRLEAALRAPALTALPDLTYPARKDSRFGVSLAHPMYLEIWELGLAELAASDVESGDLPDWLAALYASPAAAALPLDSYLHEAGEPTPPARGRIDLSWHALAGMLPTFDGDPASWEPESVLLPSQGLAVLREGDRYASLECGPRGGGHGHPDSLHLTLFAAGVHWLPDPGTGSYVSDDLFWYRSTLAHNAPRLDGASQEEADASCDAFELADGWGWVRGRFGELARTLVSGPDYLVDVLELDAAADRVLELPWHVAGEPFTDPAGEWQPASLDDRFAGSVEQLVRGEGPLVIRARAGSSSLAVHLVFDGDLLRATAPGTPGSAAAARFHVQRVRGRSAQLVAVIDSSPGADLVRAVRVSGNVIEVDTAVGTDRHTGRLEGWTVERGGARVRLGGRRTPKPPFEPLLQTKLEAMAGVAPAAPEPPALDGTLDGFDASAPLVIDHDDQYRRSELPYAGPEEFAATAWINWDDTAIYAAVEVVKPEPVFRPVDAEPLRLDNEPDDIHSDGLQIYLRDSAGSVSGVLVVPEEGGSLRARAVAGTLPMEVEGGWAPTDTGYRVTLRLVPAAWEPLPGQLVDFDLIVNEMQPDRQRRAGQLVWSGGGGWVWLRGDRQDPARFGQLELR
jgi:hypothetical protein